MRVSEGRDVDYSLLLENVDLMINTLEYDSQRSAGKMKVNVGTLNELYAYRAILAGKAKNNPTKKEG